MREFLKSLWHPLSLAGLLAWGAIGLELVRGRPETPEWLAAPLPLAVPVALHLLFLALFLWPGKNRAMVLGQLAVALALMLILRAGSLPILLIMVMAQVAHLWPVRSAALIFAACNVTVYLVYAYVWRFSAPLMTTVMYMSFQAFAAVTSWYAVSAERARDELAAINAELLGTRVLLDAGVRDSERLRISRELHDVAGHKLTALKLNLQALRQKSEFAQAAELRLAAELSDELLQDIRAVVQQLRLHDVPPLREALAALAAPLPRPALVLELEGGVDRLSMAETEAVVRCVQEALTNAARHADAGRLHVWLRQDGGDWRLDIRDDGNVLPKPGQGNGLNGMRERIEALGGRLEWHAAHGMPLSAHWPVRA